MADSQKLCSAPHGGLPKTLLRPHGGPQKLRPRPKKYHFFSRQNFLKSLWLLVLRRKKGRFQFEVPGLILVYWGHVVIFRHFDPQTVSHPSFVIRCIVIQASSTLAAAIFAL
jgi:hypothetical protein